MSDKRKSGIAVISSQRSFIMGIAILWVAWFHTDLVISISGISFFREIGYGGVDIFFLLSGIGAYFSLKKNPDSVIYMKNRAKRILPSYYPFIIVWLVMMKITGEVYGTEIIGNLTMMGWWCNGRSQFNWYTNAIWLFYLLAPVLAGIMNKAAGVRKKVMVTLLLMAAGFFASMTFFHTLLLTAFSRLPLFVLGVYLGSEIAGKKDAAKTENAQDGREYLWQKHPYIFWNMLMTAGFVLLYLFLNRMSGSMWNYGLWWYPFILIAPGLAINLGLLADWLQKSKAGDAIRKGINTVGDASFEIFLWHIGVFEFVKPRYEMNGIKWTVLLLIVILWSIGYRKTIQKLFKIK